MKKIFLGFILLVLAIGLASLIGQAQDFPGLGQKDHNPVLSADGTQTIFIRHLKPAPDIMDTGWHPSDHDEIWSMNADGSGSRCIIKNNYKPGMDMAHYLGWFGSLHASPLKDKIYFLCQHCASDAILYKANIDGTDVTRITNAHYLELIEGDPKGKYYGYLFIGQRQSGPETILWKTVLLDPEGNVVFEVDDMEKFLEDYHASSGQKSSSAASINENLVVLKYNKPIKGISIEVLWKPQALMNGYAVGPAIIQLTDKDKGTSSTVVNNHFTIPVDRVSDAIVWTETEGQGTIVNKVLLSEKLLDYTYPDIKDGTGEDEFGTTQEPFFFYDLNFDGKDEFVVFEGFTAQRYGATFRAYTIEGSEHFLLEDTFLQITYQEPYLWLDSGSTLDRKNKTLAIHYSGGALDSEDHVYELQPEHEGASKQKYVRKEIVRSPQSLSK